MCPARAANVLGASPCEEKIQDGELSHGKGEGPFALLFKTLRKKVKPIEHTCSSTASKMASSSASLKGTKAAGPNEAGLAAATGAAVLAAPQAGGGSACCAGLGTEASLLPKVGSRPCWN